jgi:Na+-driven multidrug efflux pump
MFRTAMWGAIFGALLGVIVQLQGGRYLYLLAGGDPILFAVEQIMLTAVMMAAFFIAMVLIARAFRALFRRRRS